MVVLLTVIIHVTCKGRPSVTTSKSTKGYGLIISFMTSENALNESTLLRADTLSSTDL